MKVIYYGDTLNSEPMHINHAVEKAIERTYEDGQIEVIRETIDNQTRFIGNLVELLHNKGVLADNDVLELLGEYWMKAK